MMFSFAWRWSSLTQALALSSDAYNAALVLLQDGRLAISANVLIV